MTSASLAARRKELIERCAEQRTGLAYELRALRPFGAIADHPLTGYALAHKKLVLGAAGAALGVGLFWRKRLMRLAGPVVSVSKLVLGLLR